MCCLTRCRCVSILVLIMYLSQYATTIICWCYSEETFAKSFNNSTIYRWTILTQMVISILVIIILSLWLYLREIRLMSDHVTPKICCMLLVVLFLCQFLAAIIPAPENELSNNVVYLIQAFRNLFGGGFVILYFTFDRDVNNQGRSQHENLGFIVFACVLHIFFIIMDFLINIVHETGMCTFTIYYLISILENILLFEILHVAIDLIRDTKAMEAICARHGPLHQQPPAQTV